MRTRYAYYDHLPAKTRLLNALRDLFRWGPLERWLAARTQGCVPGAGWAKLIPPEYRYGSGSRRTVERHGIRWELDISDAVDHYLYFGLKEPGFERLLALVKPTDRAIDVGANIGMLALPLARKVGASRVVAFEPDPANRSRLVRHLALNGLDQVRVEHHGLGNEARTHRLYQVVGSNAGMNRIVLDEQGSDRFPFTEIQVARLDDLWPGLGLDRVDLLKIDVEGFEHEVLKGAEGTLRAYRPLLFIELDDDNLRDNGSSAADLLRWLAGRGYTVSAALSGKPMAPEALAHCHLDVIATPDPAAERR